MYCQHNRELSNQKEKKPKYCTTIQQNKKMSKRSSTASWHITRILRESFRGLHKQPPLSQRKKKQGTPVMTQQYVKFVYKGQYYRRPIIPKSNNERQPPQLLKIPAQPLGVPKSFKEPPKSVTKIIQSEKAALVGNKSSSQQSNKQQTWSWKSWFTLNTPLLILNCGSMATLLGFTRSDVLELRTLAMTGNCTFVIYSLISPPIKWPAICWSMLFASVNGFNIAKILNERKGKVVLTPHEMEMYQEHFQPYGVTQFQFYKVITMGHTKIIPAGEIIARQGAPITSVKLVVRLPLGVPKAIDLGMWVVIRVHGLGRWHFYKLHAPWLLLLRME